MKQNNIIIIITGILLFLTACSNDFLDEKPGIAGISPNPIYISDETTGLQEMIISIPEIKNAHFEIRQFPKWMSFQRMEGNFSDGIAEIRYEILFNELYYTEYSNGELYIDVQGLGLIGINIIYDKNYTPDE